MTQTVDDGDDQTAEANGAKAVGQGASRGAASWALGHVVRAEVPAAVDTGNGGVDQVLEDFGDPVSGEGDEDDQSDDRGGRAAASAGVTCWVGAWFVFDVDGH